MASNEKSNRSGIEMKLDHLIFTRFSLRDVFPQVRSRIDPLDPEFLELRINLIRMISLPSILSQTDQNFAWVIVVDNGLPPEWRKVIEEIASTKKRAHVVNYCGNEQAWEIDWVRHLILPGTEYLITTLLDDDDSLPINYSEMLQNRVRQGTWPPAMILAASQITQWDMKFSSSAAYGYKCPWHRTQTKASSCGFSLACKYPEISLSVLTLKHRSAFNYLAFSEAPSHDTVSRLRSGLFRQCEAAGLDIISASSADLIVDMSEIVGPVLMTNHRKNAEHQRLSERKEVQETVEGPTTFENFSINWAKVKEYSFLFRNGEGS